MFSPDPFYHRLIRRYVTVFGTLFNNLYLVRHSRDGVTKFEKMKVPLAYASKEKFLTRLRSDPQFSKATLMNLPRLAFEMTGISYDPSRKQQTTLKHFYANTSTNITSSQYIAAPYALDFTLSLYVRNIEDGTQIIEQILPYFQPDYTPTVHLVPSMGIVRDIPIILNSVEQTSEVEGDFGTTRFITWTLTFTLKGYFMGPATTANLIMGVANVTNSGAATKISIDQNNAPVQKLVMANTGSGRFIEGESIRIANKSLYGMVESWNVNTYTILVSGANGVLSANDVMIGDESNANFTISTTEYTSLSLVVSRVKQDTISMTQDDDFGYTTTLTEYPDTL